MKNTLTYLKTLVKDPNVASITPTSSYGVERILRKIDFQAAMAIVEYGPGGGVFTRRLLQRMRPDAKLIVIETNSGFCGLLSQRINDSRLKIYNQSAENVLDILAAEGVTHADAIISGIPFSFFPTDLKDRILTRTAQALGSKGTFYVYQFLLSFSASKNDIRKKLSEHLELTNSEFELRCIPPLRVYEARQALIGRET